jgi:D-alanyl-D-alanine-carboxypeptidase/D-alanyl-D-alanine-endopeptidase
MAFTTDTPFEIASITKTVTASTYEWLLQTRRIGQRDTLGQYISHEVSSKIRAIPLFNLANFTSGLPQDNFASNGTLPSSLNGNYTEAELFQFLANPAFPITAPGTTFTYSNLGFSLLAFALQAAARADSFGALTNPVVLAPTGMVKTQPFSDAAAAPLPRGFDASGNPTAPGAANFPAYFGAGGLISTPNDMMTWLQFNMGIIRSESLASVLPAVQAPQAAGAANLASNSVPGLGWFVTVLNKSGTNLKIIQKNGDLDGFSSQIAFIAPNGCSTSPGGAFALVNGGIATATENSAATNIVYNLLLTMAGL